MLCSCAKYEDFFLLIPTGANFTEKGHWAVIKHSFEHFPPHSFSLHSSSLTYWICGELRKCKISSTCYFPFVPTWGNERSP